tara:strand:+ start:1721 stop:1915 length:195 start_codon:yes stop_codon:yes gene_type:complete
MKVGDLVEMSAAGKKVHSFARNYSNGWGVVVGQGRLQWNILWNTVNGQHRIWLKRVHIKRLKAN